MRGTKETECEICNETMSCRFLVDPYLSSEFDVTEEMWTCYDCHCNSLDDIEDFKCEESNALARTISGGDDSVS